MKHPDDMTVEEARDEMFALDDYFSECEVSGDGISSKETVRFRLCEFKVRLFDEMGVTLEPGTDVANYMRQAREMFAPREEKRGS